MNHSETVKAVSDKGRLRTPCVALWYNNEKTLLGEMRYDYNKGGAFAADSMSGKLSRADVSNLKITMFMSLNSENGETISNTFTVSEGNSAKLSNKLWKKTLSCKSDWTENYTNTMVYFRGE